MLLNVVITGRFAPSPTGRLHLGNLRTALAACLAVRAVGGRFVIRMEDLDRVTSSAAHERGQRADLAALGIESDVPVVRQSDRFDLYHDAIATLRAADRVYECWCTRKDIALAAQAPHGDAAAGSAGRSYPGTCRQLSSRQQAARRASGRPAALRLAVDDTERNVAFVDDVCGPQHGQSDDVVLCRNDGVPAYNLAVVVDDAAQGVTEVVRGDDLLAVTASQIVIRRLLQLAPSPTYAHVPLVVNDVGERLAKRDGAVTLDQLTASAADVRRALVASLGWTPPAEVSWAAVPRHSIALGSLMRAIDMQ